MPRAYDHRRVVEEDVLASSGCTVLVDNGHRPTQQRFTMLFGIGDGGGGADVKRISAVENGRCGPVF